jgi:hypothetical protein
MEKSLIKQIKSQNRLGLVMYALGISFALWMVILINFKDYMNVYVGITIPFVIWGALVCVGLIGMMRSPKCPKCGWDTGKFSSGAYKPWIFRRCSVCKYDFYTTESIDGEKVMQVGEK